MCAGPRRLRRAGGPPASARAHSPPDHDDWASLVRRAHCRAQKSYFVLPWDDRPTCRMPVPEVVVRSLTRVCIVCITALHWSFHSCRSTPRQIGAWARSPHYSAANAACHTQRTGGSLSASSKSTHVSVAVPLKCHYFAALSYIPSASASANDRHQLKGWWSAQKSVSVMD